MSAFGSKTDICSAKRHVRFTPNSDRESGIAAKVMSALPSKADMCGAISGVRFGPKADAAFSQPRFQLALRAYARLQDSVWLYIGFYAAFNFIVKAWQGVATKVRA